MFSVPPANFVCRGLWHHESSIIGENSKIKKEKFKCTANRRVEETKSSSMPLPFERFFQFQPQPQSM